MKRRILAVLLCAAMIIGFAAMITSTISAAPSTNTTEVNTLFKARSEGKHPRVLADESDFQRIRKLVQSDPYMKTWYAQIYDYSVGILSADLCVYPFLFAIVLAVSTTSSGYPQSSKIRMALPSFTIPGFKV